MLAVSAPLRAARYNGRKREGCSVAIKYIAARYGAEIESAHDTVDKALEAAWSDNEYEGAYPLDIYDGEALLWTNREGHPLVEGTTPLLDKLHEWAKLNGRDD